MTEGPKSLSKSHGEPRGATGSHRGPRGATGGHGEPQGDTGGHGEPQGASSHQPWAVTHLDFRPGLILGTEAQVSSGSCVGF